MAIFMCLYLVPSYCSPFDGSDSRIPVAKKEDELEHLLMHKIKVNPSFFSDYIKTPFDLSCIQNII